MYAPRALKETVDRYAGPYERWVFSDELGRPFAFPAIAGQSYGYYTALLEGAQIPPHAPDFTTRLPPLWNPVGMNRSVTPFAFFDGSAQPEATADTLQQDIKVSKLLSAVRSEAYKTRSAVNPRFRVNFPISPETWTPEYIANESPETWSEPAVKPKAIVAVIDDGLPFAHQAFLDQAGRTRVSHCWLQSGLAQQQAYVPFGRELVNTDIDALRADVGSNDAEIYRRSGAVNTGVSELGTNLRRHATHGSHVMGIAGGNGSIFADAPIGDDVQIIAVQLPNTIAWDTSGFGKEMYMLSALHYIFERASRIATHYDDDAEIPLIINFSYGWSASRHDGESEMELAIQELLEARLAIQPATALCMPAGNNFESQMHGVIAERDFGQDPASAQLGWHLQPDDLTSSYLELWFPLGFDPTGYSVTLTPPRHAMLDVTVTLSVSADTDTDKAGNGDPRRFAELEIDGANIGQLSADMHRGSRWRVMAALIPTAYTRGQDRVAPSGLWTLTVHRDATARPLAPDDDLQVWLQRDDDPSDLKAQGRQSRLVPLSGQPDHPNPLQQYVQVLGQVHGFGALNGVASSLATTRVAGFVQHTGRPCQYSAAGGLRQAIDGAVSLWGAQVDLTAVADQSAMRPGIPSIGVLSGTRARLVGTSGACPTAARMMVLNAAAGRALMHGFGTPAQLPQVEGQSANVATQHSARMGKAQIPAILKSS